jgi:hypothetical protein
VHTEPHSMKEGNKGMLVLQGSRGMGLSRVHPSTPVKVCRPPGRYAPACMAYMYSLRDRPDPYMHRHVHRHALINVPMGTQPHSSSLIPKYSIGFQDIVCTQRLNSFPHPEFHGELLLVPSYSG